MAIHASTAAATGPLCKEEMVHMLAIFLAPSNTRDSMATKVEVSWSSSICIHSFWLYLWLIRNHEKFLYCTNVLYEIGSGETNKSKVAHTTL